jgi:signal transduction histidine kinase
MNNLLLSIDKDKTFYWILISIVSFSLSLIRLHLNISIPVELIGIFFIAIIFDPWLASFTGLVLAMLQGYLLEHTYLYLLLLYVVIGLYWGYMARLGVARIWGKCAILERIKRWCMFLLIFLLGGGVIELGIKETLNELVFKQEGLVYYNQGLFKFWTDYVYNGELLSRIFGGMSWNFYLEISFIVMVSYLIYKFFPSKNRYLLVSTKVSRNDLLVEQNSLILYILGFSASLFILFLLERSDSTNFKLMDLIHTASFWGIFFIVLGAVAYFVGTKEKCQNYMRSIVVITLPPFLMIWMVLRIQNQVNIRTSYKLKSLVETAGVSFEKMNELIITQSYQQMWLTALTTISYLIGSFIIVLIIFKWNKDLEEAKDKLEDEVVERTKSLRKAQATLIENEKLVSLGRLSAEVAHEINNPLYGVLNYSDILLSKVKQDPQLYKYVQMIRSGLYYISAILKQLSGISGPSKPSFTQVDVVKLIDHSLFLVGYKFSSKKIKVVKKYAEVPTIIDADPQLLQQVFINIIHNAIQAMNGNGQENFTVGIGSGPHQTIEISFTDNASGIPDETLKNIFDPFFTTKKPEEGMGLGLTICEKIIKNHRGEIKVHSIEGKGTTFVIQLPICQDSGSEPRPEAQE